MSISVLRLGHRPERDKRITTHCALVARAWGATKFYYTGIQDKKFEESIAKAVKQWGGPFEVEYLTTWKKLFKEFPGKKVHLTMYGESYKKIRGNQLVVIGGRKVPFDLYEQSDYNFSVGNQPHSEVAALAIYLEKNSSLKTNFDNAKIVVKPMKRGKNVTSKH